ncbi:hypothetical protein [Victivallis vadensis]|uniref:hypothetical protein n=1 Tax=Victivallis vadensis TaxID=172901 RepID=UPI00164D14E9|nr:hypothetical protein [Victivallis vadensis]
MSEQVDNLQSNRPVVVGIPDALRDLLHQREAVARSWNNCRRRWWRIILPKSGG